MTSTITYASGVGSGVNVGEIYFVGGEEIVAVAVARVVVWEAHADDAIIPSRRLNKKYFFMSKTYTLCYATRLIESN